MRTGSLRFVFLLVLLALALWGGECLRRDLWEPDEARVGYIAREMSEGGHWLVPYRHGEYYAHKPPLLYWLINLFSFLTGLPVGRLTVRLPGFLAGVLTLWATARLAERWAGAQAAWPALLTLATTYLFWHETGFGRPDGLLLGWTISAMILLFLNDDRPTVWKPALAWSLMGLGILTKGPVGLIVPVGAYMTARMAAGEGYLLRKSHWLWGPLLAFVLPATWLGLVWRSGAPAGYLHELLVGQNLDRAVGGFGHVRPFYYYPPGLLIDWMPWTLCLPAAVSALCRDSARHRLLRRLAGWMGFVILFFSCLVTKRHVYVLAATPAFAILVGAAWSSMQQDVGRWIRVVRIAFPLLLLVAGIGLLAGSYWPKLPIVRWPFRLVGLLALAGASVLWHAAQKSWSAQFFQIAALVWLTLKSTVGTFVYPAINPLKTPAALVEALKERLPAERPLLLYSMNDEILAYHAHRRGRVVHTPEELAIIMRREQPGVVVFKKADFDAWSSNASYSSAMGHEFTSGSKHYVWVEFNFPDKPSARKP